MSGSVARWRRVLGNPHGSWACADLSGLNAGLRYPGGSRTYGHVSDTGASTTRATERGSRLRAVDVESRRTVSEAVDLLTRLSVTVDAMRQELALIRYRVGLTEAALGLAVQRGDRSAMRARVIELRKEGFSISRICAATGRSTVHRHLATAPDADVPEFIVTANGKRYPAHVARRNGARLNDQRLV
jgi:hypothetical protein